MVLTGKSIDRKDKLTHIFSEVEMKKALGTCPTAAKEFQNGEHQDLAGQVNALVLAGSGEQRDQNPGGTSLTQDTACKEFSVWVTPEVTLMGLRNQP